MKKRKQNATAKPVNAEQRQKPRVIILDIETCPILAYTFGTRKVNISLEQVVKPTAILSVSWKFLDGDEVYFWSNEGQKDPWDDLNLCQSLWGLINQVDAVIGHNSERFDMPIIYGRFYHHGLPPVRKPRNLDTLQMARQIGRHFSGKLAHLSGKLDAKKSEHAKFPGFKLWAETLKGDPEAWQEMKEYNDQDVRATEALFKDMLPYAKTGLYFEDAPADVPVCPRCGSHHVQKRGVSRTMGGTYQRFKCLDCGGWSQSRFTQRDRKVSRNTLKAI